MSKDADERYVEQRSKVESEIDTLFSLGEECGFRPDQVADDVLEHLDEEHDIKCSQD